MKYVLFLALAASRVLPESGGQKALQIRRRNQKPLFFAAVSSNETKPSLLKNATKLWMKQAWLCDAGVELMNVEGFAMNECKAK